MVILGKTNFWKVIVEIVIVFSSLLTKTLL